MNRSSLADGHGRLPRLLLTPGDPAGIGPELAVKLAQRNLAAQLVVLADPQLLAATAKACDLPLRCVELPLDAPLNSIPPASHQPGTLQVYPIATAVPARAGLPDAANAGYVLSTLQKASDWMLEGQADALVTGPVSKELLHSPHSPFSGHTEFFAQRAAAPQVVMLLACAELKVALVTTHLPLKDVANAITQEQVEKVLQVLHTGLQQAYGRTRPRIAVLGLNPHAGEGGILGREEQLIIEPVLQAFVARGHQIEGPLPADTAFSPERMQRTDAFLAMYHDQGLPVLKFCGFGRAANVTLGLPYVRTSVDHGTAFGIAGRNVAQLGSLSYAVEHAIELVKSRRQASENLQSTDH